MDNDSTALAAARGMTERGLILVGFIGISMTDDDLVVSICWPEEFGPGQKRYLLQSLLDSADVAGPADAFISVTPVRAIVYG